MNLAIPTAPKRRGEDTWRSYVPGALLIVAGVASHAFGWIGEHPTMAIIGFGGMRLPRGRFRDGKRWLLAENSRTEEREAVP